MIADRGIIEGRGLGRLRISASGVGQNVHGVYLESECPELVNMDEERVWEVDDHLRGKPDFSVDLFHRFVKLVETCGPFRFSVSKTTITFKGSRRGFAGARPTSTGLRGYLDLQRNVHDARIRSVAPYQKKLFVHHFSISRAEELDAEFAAWVKEAYAVGEGLT